MKAKVISLFLAFAMIVSLTAALAVSVSADSSELQVCTDVVEVNNIDEKKSAKHESTATLTADRWFDETYGEWIVDEDGSITTFRVRGWANPLDGSDLLQYGYSLTNDDIIWDDSFMAPEEGLHGFFAKAERFDLTVNLGYLPVGTYDFHLYAKTTSGVYEVEEEAFVFEKNATLYENVALGKYVSTDHSMEASFFSAQMLTDGLLVPFVEQTDPLGWTAGTGPFFAEQDQEIYVYIDLNGKFEVGCVNVFPQLFLDGSGFPSSFTILTGMTMDDMTPVASVKNINESQADATTDPTVLAFTPTVCKYVAFRVDRASWLQEQDGSYLSEVGEIEVYGRPAPKATYTVTFKDGDKVIATVTYEEGAKSIDVPEVPAKEGCEGVWESFKLENKDIEVKAIYTLITSADTEAPTEPATDPATEPATEPATVPATEPATEPATDPATDPAATDEGGNDKGCSSVLSASAALLIVLLGGAVVLNKRKD
ncbi:MAG: hypothetical protein MJ192_04260 [Clostridia bacterium]|nr:hypothetical protein [Clostridia bacterium]